MNDLVWKLPFFAQALLIFIDEFYFHHKRGLPKWEQIGHPLDTLTILIVLLWTFFADFTQMNLNIFIALSLLSLIFITKDEFVHKDICPKKEMWLHALLFINHPLLIISLGFLWQKGMLGFIKTQSILVFMFMSYQYLYWNFVWKPKKAL